MKHFLTRLAAVAAMACSLAACGGSDSTDPAPTPTPTPAPTPAPTPQATAEGVYKGSLSSGARFYTLVLENGEFHTAYTAAASNALAGMVHGKGASAGGKFTSSQATDYGVAAQPIAVSVTADYAPGASFNGTVTTANGALTFTGQAPAAAEYSYTKPAALSDVAGRWSLVSIEGAEANATVAADGTFNTTLDGCAFSGAFKPRASGKNVFDVALSFGPAPCVLAGQRLDAHAILYNDNGLRMLATGVDESKKVSVTVLGTGAR